LTSFYKIWPLFQDTALVRISVEDALIGQ
jgi:hypothetical protein